MKPLPRAPGPDWGTIFVPAVGVMPPAVPTTPSERVFHVALRTPFEGQPALARALRSIASHYVEADWQDLERKFGAAALQGALVETCRVVQPTLVFMQIQRAGAIPPSTIEAMRHASPGATLVNWDGDQHHEPADPERAWFVELGRVCDTSLVVNTEHPYAYARMGVRNPGYLQIGVDTTIYTRTTERLPRSVPRLIFLASNYPSIAAYDWRRYLVDRLAAKLDEKFAVYGGGWQERQPKHARPMLTQPEEAMAYSACQFALSSSIRYDLARYTSDRLLRALACGADVLVEHFPDMEGLGLRPGENCQAFDETTLFRHLEPVAAEPYRPDPVALARRGAAYELGQTYHSWDARMPELMAIVQAVRGRA